MALTIVFNIILNMFGLSVVNGIQLSVVLAALLGTNAKARKHLRLRLRQNLDSLSVGRSSRVEPEVSIAYIVMKGNAAILTTNGIPPPPQPNIDGVH